MKSILRTTSWNKNLIHRLTRIAHVVYFVFLSPKCSDLELPYKVKHTNFCACSSSTQFSCSIFYISKTILNIFFIRLINEILLIIRESNNYIESKNVRNSRTMSEHLCDSNMKYINNVSSRVH